MDFQQMLEQNGARLRETLAEINAEIDSRITGSEQLVHNEQAFMELVINKLIERSVIPMTQPDDMNPDEYLEEHRFDAKFGNSRVALWGSALLGTVDEGFTLHLFASDFTNRSQLELLEEKTYNSACRSALNFFHYAVNGKMEQKVSPNHQAYKRCRQIRNYFDHIQTVRFWLISNRVFEGTCAGQEFFPLDGRTIEISVQIVDLSYLSNLLKTGEPEISQSFDEIGGIECVVHPADDDQDFTCLQTAFKGSDLARLYGMHGTAIVQANVRAYLGERKVNKAIRHTAENEPWRFLAYNNGLAIVASSSRMDGNRLMELTGIQIVNGGQTTASLHQCWLSGNNSRSEEKREHINTQLEKLLVPAKIIIPRQGMTEGEIAALQEQVSEAANSQNAVRRSDLSANQPFQIAFARRVNSMPTPGGGQWFYERAQGMYTAELTRCKGCIEKSPKAFKAQYPAEKIFGKTDLALAMLAWEGAAASCAKGKELAFVDFASRFSQEKDEERPIFSDEQVKQMICKWMLMKELERAAKDAKEYDIKNPRVPICYAITLFSKHWGDRVKWDIVWNHQGWSDAFLNDMLKLTAEVNTIMKKHMGSFMIAMWGRKRECMETLLRDFDPKNFSFDQAYDVD